MPSITCLVTLKRLVRLVSITAVQSSCVILRNTTSRVMPALFTSTSISPTSALTLSNAALVDSQSPTLPSDAMKSKPSAFCSSSHFTRRGEVGPQPATTLKPSLCSRWQILVPMPPIPPVTYAIRCVINHTPLSFSRRRPAASSLAFASSPLPPGDRPARPLLTARHLLQCDARQRFLLDACLPRTCCLLRVPRRLSAFDRQRHAH